MVLILDIAAGFATIFSSLIIPALAVFGAIISVGGVGSAYQDYAIIFFVSTTLMVYLYRWPSPYWAEVFSILKRALQSRLILMIVVYAVLLLSPTGPSILGLRITPRVGGASRTRILFQRVLAAYIVMVPLMVGWHDMLLDFVLAVLRFLGGTAPFVVVWIAWVESPWVQKKWALALAIAWRGVYLLPTLDDELEERMEDVRAMGRAIWVTYPVWSRWVLAGWVVWALTVGLERGRRRRGMPRRAPARGGVRGGGGHGGGDGGGQFVPPLPHFARRAGGSLPRKRAGGIFVGLGGLFAPPVGAALDGADGEDDMWGADGEAPVVGGRGPRGTVPGAVGGMLGRGGVFPVAPADEGAALGGLAPPMVPGVVDYRLFPAPIIVAAPEPYPAPPLRGLWGVGPKKAPALIVVPLPTHRTTTIIPGAAVPVPVPVPVGGVIVVIPLQAPPVVHLPGTAVLVLKGDEAFMVGPEVGGLDPAPRGSLPGDLPFTLIPGDTHPSLPWGTRAVLIPPGGLPSMMLTIHGGGGTVVLPGELIVVIPDYYRKDVRFAMPGGVPPILGPGSMLIAFPLAAPPVPGVPPPPILKFLPGLGLPLPVVPVGYEGFLVQPTPRPLAPADGVGAPVPPAILPGDMPISLIYGDPPLVLPRGVRSILVPRLGVPTMMGLGAGVVGTPGDLTIIIPAYLPGQPDVIEHGHAAVVIQPGGVAIVIPPGGPAARFDPGGPAPVVPLGGEGFVIQPVLPPAPITGVAAPVVPPVAVPPGLLPGSPPTTQLSTNPPLPLPLGARAFIIPPDGGPPVMVLGGGPPLAVAVGDIAIAVPAYRLQPPLLIHNGHPPVILRAGAIAIVVPTGGPAARFDPGGPAPVVPLGGEGFIINPVIPPVPVAGAAAPVVLPVAVPPALLPGDPPTIMAAGDAPVTLPRHGSQAIMIPPYGGPITTILPGQRLPLAVLPGDHALLIPVPGYRPMLVQVGSPIVIPPLGRAIVNSAPAPVAIFAAGAVPPILGPTDIAYVIGPPMGLPVGGPAPTVALGHLPFLLVPGDPVVMVPHGGEAIELTAAGTVVHHQPVLPPAPVAGFPVAGVFGPVPVVAPAGGLVIVFPPVIPTGGAQMLLPADGIINLGYGWVTIVIRATGHHEVIQAGAGAPSPALLVGDEAFVLRPFGVPPLAALAGPAVALVPETAGILLVAGARAILIPPGGLPQIILPQHLPLTVPYGGLALRPPTYSFPVPGGAGGAETVLAMDPPVVLGPRDIAVVCQVGIPPAMFSYGAAVPVLGAEDEAFVVRSGGLAPARIAGRPPQPTLKMPGVPLIIPPGASAIVVPPGGVPTRTYHAPVPLVPPLGSLVLLVPPDNFAMGPITTHYAGEAIVLQRGEIAIRITGLEFEVQYYGEVIAPLVAPEWAAVILNVGHPPHVAPAAAGRPLPPMGFMPGDAIVLTEGQSAIVVPYGAAAYKSPWYGIPVVVPPGGRAIRLPVFARTKRVKDAIFTGITLELLRGMYGEDLEAFGRRYLPRRDPHLNEGPKLIEEKEEEEEEEEETEDEETEEEETEEEETEEEESEDGSESSDSPARSGGVGGDAAAEVEEQDEEQKEGSAKEREEGGMNATDEDEDGDGDEEEILDEGHNDQLALGVFPYIQRGIVDPPRTLPAAPSVVVPLRNPPSNTAVLVSTEGTVPADDKTAYGNLYPELDLRSTRGVPQLAGPIPLALAPPISRKFGISVLEDWELIMDGGVGVDESEDGSADDSEYEEEVKWTEYRSHNQASEDGDSDSEKTTNKKSPPTDLGHDSHNDAPLAARNRTDDWFGGGSDRNTTLEPGRYNFRHRPGYMAVMFNWILGSFIFRSLGYHTEDKEADEEQIMAEYLQNTNADTEKIMAAYYAATVPSAHQENKMPGSQLSALRNFLFGNRDSDHATAEAIERNMRQTADHSPGTFLQWQIETAREKQLMEERRKSNIDRIIWIFFIVTVMIWAFWSSGRPPPGDASGSHAVDMKNEDSRADALLDWEESWGAKPVVW